MASLQVIRTEIEGVSIVESTPSFDDRGYFERIFSDEDFRQLGLPPGAVTQCAVSYNSIRGTLRGLHYQEAPHGEAKLVRCLRGAIHDVALDLRGSSPTYGRSVAVELRAEAHRALYIPAGCAHGFLTLSDDATVLYCIYGSYAPAAAGIVRWDDPAFSIAWPFEPTVMSQRDREALDHDK
jgi:dTDP-4-dehydrorhamnose 3,5-epimerase